MRIQHSMRYLLSLTGISLLVIAVFLWNNFSSGEKSKVIYFVKNAVNSALQASIVKANPNSYDKENLNNGPTYLIPQFSSDSPKGSGNVYNLESYLFYTLNYEKGMPYYRISNINEWQFYDNLTISIHINYELFWGITDSMWVTVDLHVPKKQLK